MIATSKNSAIKFLWQCMAFMLPLYMIYYWELHELKHMPNIKMLWITIILGLIFYLMITVSFIILN